MVWVEDRASGFKEKVEDKILQLNNKRTLKPHKQSVLDL